MWYYWHGNIPNQDLTEVSGSPDMDGGYKASKTNILWSI